MNHPKVSVIIAFYNGEKYICEAVDSVFAQTYKNLELIVIDDGSVDNAREALQKYNGKIKYIYQDNQGVAAARNKGVKISNGKYVAFLDHDDLWKPHKLATQINIIENDDSTGLVASLMDAIGPSGESLNMTKPRVFPGDTFETAFFRGSSYPSTFLIRRSCFENVGLFDESIAIYDDLDIYLRIAQKYKIVMLTEPLTYYRIHSSNEGKNWEKAFKNQIIFSKKWYFLCSDIKQKKFLIAKIKEHSFLLSKYNLKRFFWRPFYRYFLIFIKTFLLNINKSLDKKLLQ